MILSIRYIIKFTFAMLLLLLCNSKIVSQCNFEQGPVGELCTSAIYICGSELDGFSSKLPEELSAPQTWTGLCALAGNADNIMWLSFTPCDNTVTLEITPFNCTVVNTVNTGIQAGIFSDCDRNASLDCSDTPGSINGQTSTFTLSSDQFVPGQPAFLFLDGYAGSVCEFTIKVIEGINTDVVTPPDSSTLAEGFITGNPAIPCDQMNVPKRYNLTPPQCEATFSQNCGSPTINPADSICYVWQVSPVSGRYFDQQDSVGRSVDIVFTEPGTYTISTDGFFHPFYGGSCANAACGEILTWTVTVAAPDTIINSPIFICPGNSFLFCGNVVTSDTTIVCSVDPCKIAIQSFVVGTSNVNQLGTKYICNGSSFVFQGVSYDVPGAYEVVDDIDCSLLHRFRIEILDLSLNVSNGINVIDCNNPKVSFTAIGAVNGSLPLTYTWKNILNQVISNTDTAEFDAAGSYVIELSYPSSTGICTTSQVVTITQDKKRPAVTAFTPTLRCTLKNDPAPILTLVSADNIIDSEWTTPLGDKVNGMNILVDSINVVTGQAYQFMAVGANGCVLDTSFIVPSNFNKAAVSINGQDLTCYAPESQLLMTTDIGVDSVRWSRITPSSLAFFGSDDQAFITVNTEGLYRADVMASSSHCWSFGEKDLKDKKLYPTADVGVDQKWYCNTTNIPVSPSVTTGSEIQYFWGSIDGSIASNVTEANVTINSPGQYVLSVFNVDNGCQSHDTLQIVAEENVPTSLDFYKSDINCFGYDDGLIEIISPKGGFAPYYYYLNGQLLSQDIIQNLSPGNYTLEVRDLHDCSYEIVVDISEPDDIEVYTPLEFTIAFNEVIDISFLSNYDDEISTIKWYDGDGNIIGTEMELPYSSVQSDVIEVEVTTVNGCLSRSKITIKVDNELKMYFPNAFSPNGDNINDRFVIYKNKIPATIDRLSIYDRYGNKVHEQEDFEFGDNPLGWDGTVHGNQVAVGVYVYVIEYTDFTGKKEVIKKDLTLIR